MQVWDVIADTQAPEYGLKRSESRRKGKVINDGSDGKGTRLSYTPRESFNIYAKI